MRKIINGRRYDTATAEHIGGWGNGRYGRDFEACSEDLYRKRTGEYFLLGDGGPLSKYAERHGNETSGSTVIIPLSEDDAREWAESHLDADEYEAAFGAVEEEEAANPGLLKELREKAGRLSQQALADAAGLNIRQVQKYEGGEAVLRNMTLQNAAALAKALGVAVEELLK